MKKTIVSMFVILITCGLFFAFMVRPAYCEGRGLLGMLFGDPESLAKRQFKFINYTDNKYSPKPKDSPVELFFQDNPQKEYEVIGEITGYIEKEENIKPTISAKVRQVGGDGLIDIQTSEGSQAYSRTHTQSNYDFSDNKYHNTPVSHTYSANVTNIKGKVIRYKAETKQP